jgi:hypothetical protein
VIYNARVGDVPIAKVTSTRRGNKIVIGGAVDLFRHMGLDRIIQNFTPLNAPRHSQRFDLESRHDVKVDVYSYLCTFPSPTNNQHQPSSAVQ